MMKFIKNNYVLLMVCFLFLFMIGYAVVGYIIDEEKMTQAMSNQSYKMCIINESEEICSGAYQEVPKRDTMSTLDYMLSIHGYSLKLFAPLLIIIISSYCLYNYFKTGYLKNSICRQDYKQTFKIIYLKVMKYSFILPLFMFLLFIIAYIISGNFNYEVGANTYFFVGFSLEYAKNWPIFMFVFILNFWLHSIFIINIAIIELKENKELLSTIIISFIIYRLLILISEVVGKFLFSNQPIRYYFLLTSIWSYYNGHIGLLGSILVSLLLVFITTIIVYINYRNREEVLEELEK